jgi:hypothetical protein
MECSSDFGYMDDEKLTNSSWWTPPFWKAAVAYGFDLDLSLPAADLL